MVAFDDVSGQQLEASLMIMARADEIAYFREMGVHEKVNVSECWTETGKAPIAVRWVDINKGDTQNPNYRSRLVAKEFNTGVRPELYAATPPSEVFSTDAEPCRQRKVARNRAHVCRCFSSVLLR